MEIVSCNTLQHNAITYRVMEMMRAQILRICSSVLRPHACFLHTVGGRESERQRERERERERL